MERASFKEAAEMVNIKENAITLLDECSLEKIRQHGCLKIEEKNMNNSLSFTCAIS